MSNYILKNNVWYWKADRGLIPVDVRTPSSPLRRDFMRSIIVQAKQKMDKENALVTRLRKWKKDQGIIALTIDELKKEAKPPLISEQKVDGESALLDYRDGSAKFAGLGGRITWDIPVLEEIESVLKKSDISDFKAVGELAGYEDGKIIPFDETESIIKNPDSDKGKLHWFPYQILSIDGKDVDDNTLETYLKYWNQLKQLFNDSVRIHPVKSYKEIDKSWKELVEKEGNEGIVVRTSDGKVYKAKPVNNYDLVIVAVGDKKLKNWPKGLIGNVLAAFMDKDGFFRIAGEVGTGWNEEERRELFQWAKKNEISEDDHYIWVKPERIIEVQWERTNIKDMPSYNYEKGKYEKLDKKPVGTIVKPRFIRYRDDKEVNKNDLRLTQIPNWSERKKSAMIRVSDYPDHPDDIVISSKERLTGGPNINEIDVWSYYNGIKKDIIKRLKDHNLFIVIKSDSKPIYIRHPYDKKTEFIRINNIDDFDEYHSGRTVEYHITMPSRCPYYIVDFDGIPGDKFEKTKKVAGEVADRMKENTDVKKVEIRYTGKRGFHILGWLKKPINIDIARNNLKEWLREKFGDHKDVIIAETAKDGKGALGVAPMKLNGGHVAKHSMRITGLCCVEVDRGSLNKFNRESARFEKIYKKITGKEYEPVEEKNKKRAASVINAFLKVSGYDREKLKKGYKGTFVIQEHDADKAGKHWDVRISFPVDSISKALKDYNNKNDVDKGKDKKGEVYRSFVDRKMEIPTKDNKVYLVETEDHPLSYGKFEGTIPEGSYGAGKVKIYDHGPYELLESDGDKTHVIDFKGSKLSGTYALVKYQNGYLWVKSNKNKKASTIDYVRPTLPPQIWDLDKDPPILRHFIRRNIIDTLLTSFEEKGIIRPLRFINGLTLSGSICTYNYDEVADVDVDITFDYHKFLQAYPEYSKLQGPNLFKEIERIAYSRNGSNISGTTHHYSFMLMKPGEGPSGDAFYDILNGGWIKPPIKIPMSFDPDVIFSEQIEQAKRIIEYIDDIVRETTNTVYELKYIDDFIKLYGGMKEKRIVKLYRLKELCKILNDMHNYFWDLHSKIKDPDFPKTYPSFKISPNWSKSMIILKYINKYGYLKPVKILYKRLEGNPYLKIIDQFIPC